MGTKEQEKQFVLEDDDEDYDHYGGHRKGSSKGKRKGKGKKGKDFAENYEQSYRDGRQGARGQGIERKPTEERQDQVPMKYGSNKWCRHQLDTLTEQMAGLKQSLEQSIQAQ